MKQVHTRVKSHFCLLIGGVLITCLLAEGALRTYRFLFVFPRTTKDLRIVIPPGEDPSQVEFMREIPGLFIPDAHVVHRYRPKARIRWRGTWYDINAQGWRGPDWPKVHDKDNVVLCLGDSITFGYGAPFEVTFCNQLQQLLQKKFPNQSPIVLNAASTNYNTEQELYIFKELFPVWKPDVVLLNFYKNDIYPCEARVDEQGRLSFPSDPDLLESRSFFSPFFNFVRRHSLLATLLEDRMSSLVTFWMLRFPPTVPRYYEARCWRETDERLRELVLVARQAHVQVILAYFPDVFELGRLRVNLNLYRFRRIAQELRVPVVDISRLFNRHPREKLYLDMCHLNARGHELVARALAEAVESLLASR